MDALLVDIAQKYMYGYTGPNSPNATYNTWATRSTSVERFTVNAPFFYANCSLVAAIALLLVITSYLPSARDRRPLDLGTFLGLEAPAEMHPLRADNVEEKA